MTLDVTTPEELAPSPLELEPTPPPAPVTGRPPGHMSYAEATAATGRSLRQLRRLVSAGTIEFLEGADGRRWLATGSLLAAGMNLRGPGGQDGQDAGSEADTGGGHGPAMATLREELEALRRRAVVAEALADERAREVEWLRGQQVRLVAALPPAEEDRKGGHGRGQGQKRWWRRSQ